MLSIKIPYNLVREYFNHEVALYFAWLFHYTIFILFPSFASIIIFLLKFIISNKQIENIRMFYAIGIAIWVQFFIISWNKNSNALQIKWNKDN